jgi:hypothetical protein
MRSGMHAAVSLSTHQCMDHNTSTEDDPPVLQVLLVVTLTSCCSKQIKKSFMVMSEGSSIGD